VYADEFGGFTYRNEFGCCHVVPFRWLLLAMVQH
jgi:hypothetical protein